MPLTALTHNVRSEEIRLRKSEIKLGSSRETGVNEAKHINLWKMPDCFQLYCHDLLIYPLGRKDCNYNVTRGTKMEVKIHLEHSLRFFSFIQNLHWGLLKPLSESK